MTKRFSKFFWQEEEEVYVASWARWDARWKGLVEKMSRRKSGNTNAEQKTRNIQNAIEGKLRVQSRASELLQDQINH